MCINPSPESLADPFALGIAFMGESHRMLHEQLDQLASVPDADYSATFEVLLKQVDEHFKEEEQAMEKIAFAGIACHRAQHDQAISARQHGEAQEVACARQADSVLYSMASV